jgi:hypothetical protein
LTFGISCQAGEKACVLTAAECPQGALVETDCDAGHYCPKGTENPKQWPCPPGTYTAATNLKAEAECTECPETKACPIGTVTPKDCADGHYCPLGTWFTVQFPCEAGTYYRKVVGGGNPIKE